MARVNANFSSANSVEVMNPHVRPYYVTSAGFTVTHLIRLDHLVDDYESLAEVIPNLRPIPAKPLHVGANPGSWQEEDVDWVKVAEIYAEDFELEPSWERPV